MHDVVHTASRVRRTRSDVQDRVERAEHARDHVAHEVASEECNQDEDELDREPDHQDAFDLLGSLAAPRIDVDAVAHEVSHRDCCGERYGERHECHGGMRHECDEEREQRDGRHRSCTLLANELTQALERLASVVADDRTRVAEGDPRRQRDDRVEERVDGLGRHRCRRFQHARTTEHDHGEHRRPQERSDHCQEPDEHRERQRHARHGERVLPPVDHREHREERGDLERIAEHTHDVRSRRRRTRAVETVRSELRLDFGLCQQRAHRTTQPQTVDEALVVRLLGGSLRETLADVLSHLVDTLLCRKLRIGLDHRIAAEIERRERVGIDGRIFTKSERGFFG